MNKFTHISFYKFVEISSPQELQESLKELTKKLQLKGTILLATEGINGMLAGSEPEIQTFISEFQKDLRFCDIFIKKNKSTTQPFFRMLIKVKKEILTFNEPEIKPHVKTGKYVQAKELHQWLRDGSDITLIDARNEFEIKYGSFQNSINPKIKSFTQFKKAVDDNMSNLKEKRIVTFCTGGIRCEKASAYMLEKGFKEVYQLSGGILRYLEETNGEFWQGECFVFDNRIALDKDLNEVSTKS